jgi:uncharacterized protein YukE
MLIRITPGEVADRLSIQSIRLEKLGQKTRIQELQEEVDMLRGAWVCASATRDELPGLLQELSTVNAALWAVEDELRHHEKLQDFGADFVQRARSVYRFNDERAAIKKRINELSSVCHTEVKIYAGQNSAGRDS